ncbi:MAG: formylglycine-generating enzyme family protein [Polyangiales bacterium]
MRGVRVILAIASVSGVMAVASLGAPRRSEGAQPVLRCRDGALPIPAGEFPIGTTRSQDYEEDEQPRRMFSLSKPYCLDRTEITVASYAACAKAGTCVARSPHFLGESMPMTNVSWHDARAACAFRGGRLPTEIEWEHAARGNDDRLYPWGSWHPDCPYADLWGEIWGNCDGYGPSPVGGRTKGASPYGVLDLAGNVLEWVDDAYDGRSWAKLPTLDLHRDDPKAPRHGVRGGSWDYDVVHSLRVSDRDGYPSDLRDATLGFRCAYDVLPP